MVRGESVFLCLVEREDADYPFEPFQWHRQRGTQSAELGGVIQISGFDGWIAVDDGLLVLGDPAGQSLSQRDFQGSEEPEIIAVYVLRQEFVATLHINSDGIVRDQ